MAVKKDPHRYDDIISLPYHPAAGKMPMSDRAAQFVPLEALTDQEAAVAEEAGLSVIRIGLGELDDTHTDETLLDRR